MGVNNFYSFASVGATNLISLVDYAASAARKAGLVTGAASSALFNRAFRQSANMASALGEAVIVTTPLDVNDDGNIAVLRDTLLAAIRAAATPRQDTYAVGVYSWVVPAGVYFLRVRAWGAGGGGGGAQGGGAAGGGGGGAYVEGLYPVVPGDTIDISVGTGGAGGSSTGGSALANKGGDGGSTEVLNNTTSVSYANAGGGVGGSGTFTSGSGSGGVGGSADLDGALNVNGGDGEAGYTGTPARGGSGGMGALGGAGGCYRTTTPTIGNFPGGAGAGGNGTQAGAAAVNGYVILEY